MLPKILRLSSDVRRIAVVFSAVAILAGLAPAMLFAQATPSLVTNRLTQPINESARVTLKGTVHPLANAANDRGAAPDSMPLDRIHVVLKRSSAQESALKQLITEMHTPGSSSYHKWLTPAQFGAQFGASDQDIATVEAWLQSKGFSVTKVNPGKQTLEISGNVAQFRTAFNTKIHKYVVNGETHYANATDPQIPAALAPVFGGFTSLNNFRAKKQARILGKAEYNPKTGTATPEWTVSNATGNTYLVSPQDFYAQYDLTPLYTAGINGTGQTIAIVNDSNININLVNLFRTTFNITPATNPPQVIIDGNDPGIDGINNPDGPNYDSDEAYLDVEWSGAVAPSATVDLVIAADTALESGLTLAAEHAIYSNVAPVMSISFGACESSLGTTNQFLSALWEQAAAQGITVMVSSGDNGSAGCDNDNTQYYATGGQAVSGYASTPYNVAVGGTDFYYSSYNQGASAISTQIGTYWNTTPSNNTVTPSIINGYIPEQPWNDSQYGLNISSVYANSGNLQTTIAGGSGGASTCGMPTLDANGNVTACAPYPKPAWQTGTGVPADSARDLPDVSLFAADGVNASYLPECWQDGDCQPVSSGGTIQISGGGGTSFASPSFAGIMALVNQKYGPQGQADFVLYPLATQFPTAFHDLTVGTNSVPCNIGPTSGTSSNPSVGPLDCIAVSNPITVTDSVNGTATEGQIGTGTTPEYNAGVGYDLASGLGSVDANVLVTNWGKVTFASSGVTLTSPTANATFTHGSPITFTGTVAETGTGTATPTGSVAIETTSTEPSQQGQITFPLTAGAFNGTTDILPGGTYNVSARYSGDPTNAASQSSPVQITVNAEASTLALSVLTPNSSGNFVNLGSGTTGIPYGTQLILSGQAFPTTYYTQCVNVTTVPASCATTSFTKPTGTVTFSDGTTVLNTAVVNAEGDAEYNPTDPVAAHTMTNVGSHSITASYSGDPSYSTSNSAAYTYTIVQATPTVTIAAATPNSSLPAGQATTLTILVQSSGVGAAPTGTIAITGGPSGTPATATLTSSGVDYNNGTTSSYATVVIPASVSANTYNMTFTYSGDANYITAAAQFQIPFAGTASGLKASSTVITTSGPATSPDASINVTVTVTGQGTTAPTGTVNLMTSGYTFNPLTLAPVAGTDTSTVTVNVNSQTLLQGANVLTAAYSGDSVYATSSSPAVTVANPLADFSMVPETTIVSIPSAGSATDTINLTSVNGFSGAVGLTCSATGGVLCSLSSGSPNLSSGGMAQVTLTVNNNNVLTAGTFNVLITGTDPTGEFIHTLGLSVIAPVTMLPPGLTLTGPSGITIQNPGDSGTGTLTIAPQGGITGTASFTCAVQNSPTGVTCSAPNTVGTSTTSTLTVVTTSATVAGSYTATVTATLGGQTATASVPIVVNAAAAITVSSSPTSLSFAAGATTGNTATISVMPAGGFTGMVSLSCKLTTSPTGATNVPTVSCPASVDVTGTTAVTATMTVTSTAATTGALERPLDKFFAVGGGIAVAGLLLFTIPARRRGWRSILGVLVFAAIVGMGIGCGSSGNGGGGGGGGGNSGTTTGAYAITVTGTDAATGKITNSTTVNVTVN